MLEDLGNAVGIGDVVVPAVNIQVEGVPGWLTYSDGRKDWYGVYFEVMFEKGYHWVVSQGWLMSDPNSKIQVEVYANYAKNKNCLAGIDIPDATILCSSWNEFAEMFQAGKGLW